MSIDNRPDKLAFIFGTRPEFIKLFPIVQEMAGKRNSLKVLTINTGQQMDLVNQIMGEFDFSPDYCIDAMLGNNTISMVMAKILEKLDVILENEKPSAVVVQGDTTTAYVGSLISFLKKIKVIHIEAGLRTYDNTSPFPEELFRRQISLMTDFHFASTQTAQENLIKEGIPENKIMVSGNTVIDSLRMALDVAGPSRNPIDQITLLVTFHRRENFELAVDELCLALRELTFRDSRVKIKFILHPNPNVRGKVLQYLRDCVNIELIEPLPYRAFVKLLAGVDVVMTDSGGIQEESTYLDKKLLIVRNTTERTEALTSKRARLVRPIKSEIVSSVLWAIDYEASTPENTQFAFGDGFSASRISKRIFEII